eukprot:m.651485 g.651485  ORF g.651485 m.651485 type:complete len:208 (+) comp58399_c1_seq15:2422-3045(+)
MQDLRDPLVPIQAAAVGKIARLLANKDKATMRNLSSVYFALNKLLASPDDFLLPPCVEALAAYVLIAPNSTLPLMLDRFRSDDEHVDVRIRIGEILCNVVKGLGELLPKYGDLLISAAFTAARHGDQRIRTSGLVLLSTLCEKLGFALQPFTEDIVQCVSALAKTDPDAMVAFLLSATQLSLTVAQPRLLVCLFAFFFVYHRCAVVL